MNAKNLFSLLLLLIGEALIIVCFLFFGKDLDKDILKLDVIVSSVIYTLFFIDLIFPLINFADKSQKAVGSIGLRWFFTIIYAIIAILAMFFLQNVKPIEANSQIIIQCILFFLLLIGLFFSVSSSAKVKEVYLEEKQNRNRIDDMKKGTKEMQLKLDQMKTIPAGIIVKVKALQDDLRYISPSNNQAAIDLENSFVHEIKAALNSLIDSPLNYDKITELILNCERVLKERKQIYSN